MSSSHAPMADTNARTAASATTTDEGRGMPSSRPTPLLRRLMIGTHPRRTLLRVVAIVSCAYIVFAHALIPVRDEGPSMLPTLRDGQMVLENHLAYWRTEPARGDNVALILAGLRVLYIKRIFGMPDDRV